MSGGPLRVPRLSSGCAFERCAAGRRHNPEMGQMPRRAGGPQRPAGARLLGDAGARTRLDCQIRTNPPDADGASRRLPRARPGQARAESGILPYSDKWLRRGRVAPTDLQRSLQKGACPRTASRRDETKALRGSGASRPNLGSSAGRRRGAGAPFHRRRANAARGALQRPLLRPIACRWGGRVLQANLVSGSRRAWKRLRRKLRTTILISAGKQTFFGITPLAQVRPRRASAPQEAPFRKQRAALRLMFARNPSAPTNGCPVCCDCMASSCSHACKKM